MWEQKTHLPQLLSYFDWSGVGWPFPECIDILKKDGVSSKKIADICRFCKDMPDGDIVVLRSGTSPIHGVGVIVGGYEWDEALSDVDGWDLQHVRRIKWIFKKKDI